MHVWAELCNVRPSIKCFSTVFGGDWCESDQPCRGSSSEPGWFYLCEGCLGFHYVIQWIAVQFVSKVRKIPWLIPQWEMCKCQIRFQWQLKPGTVWIKQFCNAIESNSVYFASAFFFAARLLNKKWKMAQQTFHLLSVMSRLHSTTTVIHSYPSVPHVTGTKRFHHRHSDCDEGLALFGFCFLDCVQLGAASSDSSVSSM